LSAIEQALNLTALDSRAATARKLPDPAEEPRLPAIDEEAFFASVTGASAEKPADKPAEAAPAMPKASPLPPSKPSLRMPAAKPGAKDTAPATDDEKPMSARPAEKNAARDATARPAGQKPAGVVAPDPSRVANDDKETVGALLQALQARPSPRAYWLATLASLVWLGLTGAGIWQRYDLGTTGIAGAIGAIGAVEGALLALTVFGPVVLFFVLATLHTRAQEIDRKSTRLNSSHVK